MCCKAIDLSLYVCTVKYSWKVLVQTIEVREPLVKSVLELYKLRWESCTQAG